MSRCSRRGAPRGRAAAAILIAALTVLAGCRGETARPEGRGRRPAPSSSVPTTPVAPGGFRPAPLKWVDCEQGECARLAVPLDHTDPTGSTIELALARVPARDPDARIGSLLFNPGGPGASGVDLTDYVAGALPDAIRDRFDIVGWDPRGAGASTPADCGVSLDSRFAVDTAPDDAGELAALETAAREFVDACVARTGRLLEFLSTDDTVRDMDVIRAAVGDGQLTFLGLSYGTYLGANYAARFPGQVRALVLDGAVDPARPVTEVAVEQARSFDAAFDEFLGWCRRESCGFHSDDPAAGYRSLERRIETAPLGVGDRRFGPTQLDISVAALLYSGAEAYPTLARRLQAADRGDAGGLLEVFDQYVERRGDGTYTPGWAAFIATSCADGPNLDLAATKALQQRAATEAPWFGAGNIGLGYECAFWPYPPERTTTAPIRAATTTPIVVVGTRGDPATPFQWSVDLADQLGTARLVAVAGFTHTSTLGGRQCLDEIVTRYFVDLIPPAPGIDCG